jgi:hypothetical protein
MIYIVDDMAIRNKAMYAEEFSNFGTNLGLKGLTTVNFPFIPEGEIWIAKSVKPQERHFIVDSVLSYVRNIDRGCSAGDAYDIAILHESAMREKEVLRKFHEKKGVRMKNNTHASVPKEVYKKKYGTIHDVSENVDVYLIDGEYVRDYYMTDYVEGGHGMVYEWVPKNEIWIEYSLNSEEIPAILLHEFLERTLMKYKKFPYVKAHMIASKVEFEHRGIFNKRDALKLTKAIVFQKLLHDIEYKK